MTRRHRSGCGWSGKRWPGAGPWAGGPWAGGPWGGGPGWPPGRRQDRHGDEGGWFSHTRLYRDPRHRRIRGVCAGIAAWLGVPVLAVRIPWVIFLIWNPPLALISYFVLAWLLPDRPDDLFADEKEEAFWQQVRKEPVGTVHDLRHRFRTNERRLRAIEAYVTSSEFELNRELRGL